MAFTTILSNIAKHITLNEQESLNFTSRLKILEFKKKELLLHQNRNCDTFYFVNSGTLRAFTLNEEGKETTVMFAIKDWWITDMYAFSNEMKSIVSIEALEDSQVLELKKNDLNKLFIENYKFEKFFRILMQNAYVREQLRVMQNLTLSAKQRYTNFLEKYPKIAGQLNQRQIASYLGITPEFLSMIKDKQD